MTSQDLISLFEQKRPVDDCSGYVSPTLSKQATFYMQIDFILFLFWGFESITFNELSYEKVRVIKTLIKLLKFKFSPSPQCLCGMEQLTGRVYTTKMPTDKAPK